MESSFSKDNIKLGDKILLSRAFPVTLDELGLPSKFRINGVEHKINCSIDRHHLRKSISLELVNTYYIKKDGADFLSEYYCEEKYNEYKKAVVNL